LKSRNPNTRMKAAMKLARSGDGRAITILVNVVKNENEFWVITELLQS
jgi:HEAT repeat protein